jgi:hypothetical protein
MRHKGFELPVLFSEAWQQVWLSLQAMLLDTWVRR